MSKKPLLSALALATLAFGCAAPVTGGADGTDPADNAATAQSSKQVCGVDKAARISVAPTPLPSIQEKNDAWAAADAAYSKVASILGRACQSDADCATGDASFPGVCTTPYYGQSQCTVPNAPSRPAITCADYTCPANFECEQEGTESVACVEHRVCPDEVGSGNGNGGRGKRGRSR